MRQPIDKRTLMLREEAQRERAIIILQRLPIDPERPVRVVIDDPLPAKSRDQEQKYHAMIGDIAREFEHCGRKWSADDMKRLLLDQFRRETIHDSHAAGLWASMGVFEMAPSLDGTGTVMLGVQSKKFPSTLASLFIEYLQAFGDEIGVHWSV